METQTPPVIDLSKFCSRDVIRGHLLNPFSDNEWTYATDAKLMIRVPKTGRYVDLKRLGKAILFPEKLKNAWNAWPTSDIDWFPLPELPQCETSLCEVSGPNHSECDECDGDGTFRIWPRVIVGHRTFNSMFLHKIASLPSPLVGRDYGTESDAMPFRFDGGHGLLKPIKVIKTAIK